MISVSTFEEPSVPKQKPAFCKKGGFPRKSEAMPAGRPGHRAHRSQSAFRIGEIEKMPKGTNQQTDSEPPGNVCAEIQPVERPLVKWCGLSTCPPPWLEVRGLVGRAGLAVTYRVFRGNDARETPEPPETVLTEIPPSDEPPRQHGSSESFTLSVRVAGSRPPVGFGKNRQTAAAATLYDSRPRAGCLEPRPAQRPDVFPRDSFPIHLRNIDCQGILEDFIGIQGLAKIPCGACLTAKVRWFLLRQVRRNTLQSRLAV